MTKDEAWLLEEKYGGKESSEFQADRARLANGEPVAYVIGTQPFLGLTIALDSKPLIPRPETEWWTEELITSLSSPSSRMNAPAESPLEERAQPGEASQTDKRSVFARALRSATARAGGNSPAGEYSVPSEHTSLTVLTFLDLCAGSGAIGCAALARLPHAQVSFGELDPAHEATIIKNIRIHKLDETRARVCIGSLFEPFGSERFDVIAANPPYIPEARVLPESVADYEPALALFAGSDGLAVIRALIEQLPAHLTPRGVAWIECDESHAEEAIDAAVARGFAARVLTDSYKRKRVLVLSFP